MNAYKNTILSRMPPEVIERFHLTRVDFEVGHEIEFPGTPIKSLCFLEEGMASQTVTFEDGAQVEVGMFGYESVIGVSALMGTKLSLNRIYTQVAGHGYCTPLRAARAEFERGEHFQHLALHYVQAQLLQSMQSAACNTKHHLEQRLARWLLITSDRSHRTIYKMSQEFLSEMLGNTRSAVSRAASTLKDEGLIDYRRGIVRILNLPGLERRACECYGIIKHHLDSFAEFESSDVK